MHQKFNIGIDIFNNKLPQNCNSITFHNFETYKSSHFLLTLQSFDDINCGGHQKFNIAFDNFSGKKKTLYRRLEQDVITL